MPVVLVESVEKALLAKDVVAGRIVLPSPGKDVVLPKIPMFALPEKAEGALPENAKGAVGVVGKAAPENGAGAGVELPGKDAKDVVLPKVPAAALLQEKAEGVLEKAALEKGAGEGAGVVLPGKDVVLPKVTVFFGRFVLVVVSSRRADLVVALVVSSGRREEAWRL